MPRGDKPTTTALALKDGWIYEDALPATITKDQYDWWYRESLVLDGVRMGPPFHEVEPALKECPLDLIVFWWAETLSAGEQSVLRASSRRRLQDAINTRVSADSAGTMVGRALYSELIHIAAELVRGEGFLSTCAEDMNPRFKRTDILKTAEGQERRLKDWAYRIRQVANKLSATRSPAVPRDEAARRDDAIRLLRELRETTDPDEIQRQKESWAQLERDLSNASSSPPSTEAIRRAAEEIRLYIDCNTPLCVGEPMVKQFASIITKHLGSVNG